MTTPTVISKNGVPIRLSDERWAHIIEEHGELAELQPDVLKTVADPGHVFAGGRGELLAVAEISEGKWLVVVYQGWR